MYMYIRVQYMYVHVCRIWVFVPSVHVCCLMHIGTSEFGAGLYSSHPLHLRDVQPRDAGVYTCRTSNPRTGQVAERSASVSVNGKSTAWRHSPSGWYHVTFVTTVEHCFATESLRAPGARFRFRFVHVSPRSSGLATALKRMDERPLSPVPKIDVHVYMYMYAHK